MTGDTYRNYIRDVVYLLREIGADAQRKSRKTEQSSDFDAGRALAYVEVLSMMQNQADAFQSSAAAECVPRRPRTSHSRWQRRSPNPLVAEIIPRLPPGSIRTDT